MVFCYCQKQQQSNKQTEMLTTMNSFKVKVVHTWLFYKKELLKCFRLTQNMIGKSHIRGY